MYKIAKRFLSRIPLVKLLMAQPSSLEVPGAFISFTGHFSVAHWLDLLQTQKTAHIVRNTWVTKIEYQKAREIPEHEYIIVSYTYREGGNDIQSGRLRVERGLTPFAAQPSVDDEVTESLPNTGTRQSAAPPRSPSFPSPHSSKEISSSTPSLQTAKAYTMSFYGSAANDRVTLGLEAEEYRQLLRKDNVGSYTPTPNTIPLYHVAVAAHTVSQAAAKYKLLSTQCYFFASSIWCLVGGSKDIVATASTADNGADPSLRLDGEEVLIMDNHRKRTPGTIFDVKVPMLRVKLEPEYAAMLDRVRENIDLLVAAQHEEEQTIRQRDIDAAARKEAEIKASEQERRADAEAEAHAKEAERANAEAERANAEAERANAEAERANAAEDKLRKLEAAMESFRASQRGAPRRSADLGEGNIALSSLRTPAGSHAQPGA